MKSSTVSYKRVAYKENLVHEVISFWSKYAGDSFQMWLTIFVVIMQMGVSVAIMQVVFSAVDYTHDFFYCDDAGVSFFYSYVGDSFK